MTMRIAPVLLLCTAALGEEHAPPMEAHPCAQLDNGILKATVQLPDAGRGYYRGARFDWSGLVTQVECRGHTFFGELKTPRRPTAHDHAGGICEEFGMDATPGYDEAREGETFVKIGVGTLLRGREREYRFHLPYPIAQAAPWEIRTERARIAFAQDFAGPRDWGYRYVKTVTLETGQPALTVARTLTNTGKKPIETDHYGHNMFIFDRQPIGRGYGVRFGFVPELVKPDPKAALLQDGVFRFVDETLKGSFWSPFTGFAEAGHNRLTVFHEASGLALEVATDRAPSKICLYAEKTALCPEPFVSLKLAPGESASWTTTYRFSAPGAARE